jgi:hypothetical protein
MNQAISTNDAFQVTGKRASLAAFGGAFFFFTPVSLHLHFNSGPKDVQNLPNTFRKGKAAPSRLPTDLPSGCVASTFRFN